MRCFVTEQDSLMKYLNKCSNDQLFETNQIIMKKILIVNLFFLIISLTRGFSQSSNDTVTYLITCGPGTDTYSIYGHSALRIVIPEKHTDTVYNWGVFDFNTPNFAWKFAKGRLDYMLIAESLKGFLQGYFFEQRYVYSQKINIDAPETRKLIELINENLRPENVRYRYDFFYDDCSTRIRDLLEKSIGEKLLYPPAETGKLPTFRDMVGKYQNPFPWLKFGVDLIMGSSGDKKASFRDRMFLPIDLKNELSEASIKRDGKMTPMLQNPEVLLDFEGPAVKQNFFLSPVFVFALLLIIMIIFSSKVKSRKGNIIIDTIIFSLFSVLAIMMIFFNFFTDHQQMRWNLNILWLNPFILVCLFSLIMNRTGYLWFRIVFLISGFFLVLHLFLPQAFNFAIFPLVLIILLRSSLRAGFEWNPFQKKQVQ
jgi:hypothetical protein